MKSKPELEREAKAMPALDANSADLVLGKPGKGRTYADPQKNYVLRDESRSLHKKLHPLVKAAVERITNRTSKRDTLPPSSDSTKSSGPRP